jgi:hypothetical protein
MRELELFMPGFAKPLSAWTARALEAMLDDVLAQRATATTPDAKREAAAYLSILEAEANRRSGRLTDSDAEACRQSGWCTPFTDRKPRAELSAPARQITHQREHERQHTDKDRTDDRGIER